MTYWCKQWFCCIRKLKIWNGFWDPTDFEEEEKSKTKADVKTLDHMNTKAFLVYLCSRMYMFMSAFFFVLRLQCTVG